MGAERIFGGAVCDQKVNTEVANDRADDEAIRFRFELAVADDQLAWQRLENASRVSVTHERTDEDARHDARGSRIPTSAPRVIFFEEACDQTGPEDEPN